LHLVGILFPHINDDAQSKSHKITVISLSLCSGLVDYTCSNLICLFVCLFVWFHLSYTVILHSTLHIGKRFSFILSSVVS